MVYSDNHQNHMLYMIYSTDWHLCFRSDKSNHCPDPMRVYMCHWTDNIPWHKQSQHMYCFHHILSSQCDWLNLERLTHYNYANIHLLRFPSNKTLSYPLKGNP